MKRLRRMLFTLAGLSTVGLAQAAAPSISAVTNLNYVITSSVTAGAGDFYLILWGSNFINGTTGNAVTLGARAATILYSGCNGSACQMNIYVSNGASNPLPAGNANITLVNANGTSNVVPFLSLCNADAQCGGGSYCSMANQCVGLPTSLTFMTPAVALGVNPYVPGQAVPVSVSIAGGDPSQAQVTVTDRNGTTICRGAGGCATPTDPFEGPGNHYSLYTIPQNTSAGIFPLYANVTVQSADPAYNGANHQRTVSALYTTRNTTVCAANQIVKNGACATAATSSPGSIGVVDWGATYQVTTDPKIVEGAKFVQSLGAKNITIAMSSSGQNYPGEVFSTATLTSLTDLAKTPDYQTVFNMSFSTFVISAFTYSDIDYLGNQNLTAETNEIANLVAYLMTTYKNTGKTFILKNWEGDNAMSLQNTGTYPVYNPAGYIPPPPALTTKFINWLNARHQGVLNGRAAAGAVSGVTVHDAAEMSMISATKWSPQKPDMLTAVIPYVQSDVISYSAYDTTNGPTTDNLYGAITGDVALIRNYIGGRPLIIGEVGFTSNVNQPNSIYYPDPDAREQTANIAFLDAGAANVHTWVIEDSPNAAGMGLIQPSGNVVPTYGALQRLLNVQAPVINTATDLNYATINSAQAGAGDFYVILWGSNFSAAGTTVYFGGQVVTPLYVGAGQINLQIHNSAANPLAPGKYCIRVQTSPGGTSNPYGFTITAPPLPTINAVTNLNYSVVTSTVAGSGDFYLIFWGSNFAAGTTTIYFGTQAVTPLYVSAGQINAQIPNSGATTKLPGVYNVTIQNSLGASAPFKFTIISSGTLSVSPASVQLPASGSIPETFTFTAGSYTPDTGYGIHGVCSPAGCADVALSGSWNGRVFTSIAYPYTPTLPVGPYTFASKDTLGNVYITTVTVTAPAPGARLGTNVTLSQAAVDSLRVYPNPWKPSLNAAGVTFDHLPNNSTVKLFTISAHLVKTLAVPGGTAEWDLTNDSGERVASGIYLYLVTDPQGDKTRGKVVVIR